MISRANAVASALLSIYLAVSPGVLRGEDSPGPLDVPPSPVHTVAFSPSGKLLAMGFGRREAPGGLVVWDVEKKEPRLTLRRDQAVMSVAFSPDGKLLAFAPRAIPPVIIEVDGGGEVATLADGHCGPVAFSKDGQTLFTGGNDKSVRLWDVKTRADRAVLKGHNDLIYGPLGVSPTGNLLAAACGSDGVYVWDLAEESLRHTLRHARFFTRSVFISSDGKWIVSGGFDGTTRVWNAASGEPRATLKTGGGVDSLGFEPNSGLLALASSGKAIHLHKFPLELSGDAASMQVRELLARFEDDRYDVREAASAGLVKLGFAAEPELRRAQEQSSSPEVRIRARRARQAILNSPGELLVGHESRIWCLAFSPTGRLLASAGDDGTMRLWDLTRRLEVSRFVPAAIEKK